MKNPGPSRGFGVHQEPPFWTDNTDSFPPKVQYPILREPLSEAGHVGVAKADWFSRKASAAGIMYSNCPWNRASDLQPFSLAETRQIGVAQYYLVTMGAADGAAKENSYRMPPVTSQP